MIDHRHIPRHLRQAMFCTTNQDPVRFEATFGPKRAEGRRVQRGSHLPRNCLSEERTENEPAIDIPRSLPALPTLPFREVTLRYVSFVLFLLNYVYII